MSNYVLLFILIVMTLMGAFAGLCLKKASADLEYSFFAILKNHYLYLGGFLYVISAVLNIILLSKMNYSVVLPLTAITYLWTMILSSLVLKEKVTRKKISGIVLIVVGAILLVL